MADFPQIPLVQPLSPLADDQPSEAGPLAQLQSTETAPTQEQPSAETQRWPGSDLPAYQHVVGVGDEQHLANSPDDVISMVDPSGGVRAVPFAQLEEAKASGMQIAPEHHVADWASQGDQVSMLDPQSGNVHVVPKAQYDDAVQAGLRVATPMDRAHYEDANPVVFMRSPDGAVDAKQRREMGKFAENGWVRATDEDVANEYADKGSAASYLGDRLMQGASAHLYKPLAQVWGGDDVLANIEAREAMAKGTSLETVGHVAEGAGILASALATGGAGPGAAITKAGTTMAAGQAGIKGVATKLATSFLSNAVEGGVYSAVSRTGDGLTGDAPLDVENIALGALKDAAWSGLIGAGITGTGMAANAAIEGAVDLGKRELQKLTAGKTLPEAIDNISNEWRFNQAAGSAKSEAKKIAKDFGPDGTQQLGKWLNDKNVPLEPKAAYEAIASHLDDSIGAQRELVSGLDSLGVKPDTRPLANQYVQQVTDLLSKPETKKAGMALRDDLKDIITDLAKAPGAPNKSYDTVERLWDLRKKIDEWARFDATKSNDTTSAFRNLRNVTEDNFKAIADDIVAKNPTANLDNIAWSDKWQAAKDETRMALTAERVAKNKLAASQGNNALGLRATMAGIGGAEVAAGLAEKAVGGGAAMILGPLAGVGTAIAGHAVAKFGPGVFAKGLGKLSNAVRPGGALSSVGAATSKSVSHAINTIDKASQTALLTLSRGLGTAQISGQAGAASALPLTPITAEHAAQAIDAAQQLIDGSGPAFDHADAALDKVADMHGLKFADAMQQNLTNRSQFLLAKVQANPGAKGQTKVARYVSAMKDPHAAFQRAAAGVATDEEVETLKTLYPIGFAQLVQNVQQTMPEKPNATALRKFQRQLGLPANTDLGMTMQAIAKGPSAQSPQASQKPQMAKGGGKSIDLSKGMLGSSSAAAATLSK